MRLKLWSRQKIVQKASGLDGTKLGVFHDVAVGTARVYSWGENLDQGRSWMNEALALLKDITLMTLSFDHDNPEVSKRDPPKFQGLGENDSRT